MSSGATGTAAWEKTKQCTTKKLAPRAKSKGKEIRIIGLEEELEEKSFICPRVVYGEVGDTSGFEEEYPFVDINGTPRTWSVQEGGIRRAGTVGKSVEVREEGGACQ